ncbi:hypothetical protein PPERSA_12617 [Pseudocohnilembus persalinus]|uniref:Tetratricopeptide repeat protein n=1 Tax=Pseudocohnilembus persalinus TaxID=266149 RepID=A0A0V0QCJ1_PSEPJ|nr:hypothetical protein PPERSA_12617 [Pseudocohnilembus persalinus]|eukprot:KRW99941.1 hypothetical protein PPERSA_12617 [Pseudocohnilembus persalinus]
MGNQNGICSDNHSQLQGQVDLDENINTQFFAQDPTLQEEQDVIDNDDRLSDISYINISQTVSRKSKMYQYPADAVLNLTPRNQKLLQKSQKINLQNLSSSYTDLQNINYNLNANDNSKKSSIMNLLKSNQKETFRHVFDKQNQNKSFLESTIKHSQQNNQIQRLHSSPLRESFQTNQYTKTQEKPHQKQTQKYQNYQATTLSRSPSPEKKYRKFEKSYTYQKNQNNEQETQIFDNNNNSDKKLQGSIFKSPNLFTPQINQALTQIDNFNESLPPWLQKSAEFPKNQKFQFQNRGNAYKNIKQRLDASPTTQKWLKIKSNLKETKNIRESDYHLQKQEAQAREYQQILNEKIDRAIDKISQERPIFQSPCKTNRSASPHYEQKPNPFSDIADISYHQENSKLKRSVTPNNKKSQINFNNFSNQIYNGGTTEFQLDPIFKQKYKDNKIINLYKIKNEVSPDDYKLDSARSYQNQISSRSNKTSRSINIIQQQYEQNKQNISQNYGEINYNIDRKNNRSQSYIPTNNNKNADNYIDFNKNDQFSNLKYNFNGDNIQNNGNYKNLSSIQQMEKCVKSYNYTNKSPFMIPSNNTDIIYYEQEKPKTVYKPIVQREEQSYIKDFNIEEPQKQVQYDIKPKENYQDQVTQPIKQEKKINPTIKQKFQKVINIINIGKKIMSALQKTHQSYLERMDYRPYVNTWYYYDRQISQMIFVKNYDIKMGYQAILNYQTDSAVLGALQQYQEEKPQSFSLVPSQFDKNKLVIRLNEVEGCVEIEEPENYPMYTTLNYCDEYLKDQRQSERKFIDLMIGERVSLKQLKQKINLFLSQDWPFEKTEFITDRYNIIEKITNKRMTILKLITEIPLEQVDKEMFKQEIQFCTINENYMRGNHLIDQIMTYNNIQKTNPEQKPQILFFQGAYQLSLRIFKNDIKNQYFIHELLDYYGLSYQKFDDYFNAKEILYQSLQQKIDYYGSKINIQVANSYQYLGNLSVKFDYQYDALNYFKQSLGIKLQIFKNTPHLSLAESLNSVAEVFYTFNMFQDSIRHAKNACEIVKVLFPDYEENNNNNFQNKQRKTDNIIIAEYYHTLAYSLQRVGQLEQCIKCHNLAIQRKKQYSVKGENSEKVQESYLKLAKTYEIQLDFTESTQILLQILDFADKTYVKNKPFLIKPQTLLALGRIQNKSKNYQKASEFLEQALYCLNHFYYDQKIQKIEIQFQLAYSYLFQNQYEKAKNQFIPLIQAQENINPNSFIYLESQKYLQKIDNILGQNVNQTLIQSTRNSHNNQITKQQADDLIRLAQDLKQQDQYNQAREYLDKAQFILQQLNLLTPQNQDYFRQQFNEITHLQKQQIKKQELNQQVDLRTLNKSVRIPSRNNSNSPSKTNSKIKEAYQANLLASINQGNVKPFQTEQNRQNQSIQLNPNTNTNQNYFHTQNQNQQQRYMMNDQNIIQSLLGKSQQQQLKQKQQPQQQGQFGNLNESNRLNQISQNKQQQYQNPKQKSAINQQILQKFVSNYIDPSGQQSLNTTVQHNRSKSPIRQQLYDQKVQSQNQSRKQSQVLNKKQKKISFNDQGTARFAQ